MAPGDVYMLDAVLALKYGSAVTVVRAVVGSSPAGSRQVPLVVIRTGDGAEALISERLLRQCGTRVGARKV